MNTMNAYVSTSEEMRGGAVAAAEPVALPTAVTANESGDPRVGWLIALLIAATVAVTVWYLVIYVGVQYSVPSWGAHAYPPPLLN